MYLYEVGRQELGEKIQNHQTCISKMNLLSINEFLSSDFIQYE